MVLVHSSTRPKIYRHLRNQGRMLSSEGRSRTRQALCRHQGSFRCSTYLLLDIVCSLKHRTSAKVVPKKTCPCWSHDAMDMRLSRARESGYRSHNVRLHHQCMLLRLCTADSDPGGCCKDQSRGRNSNHLRSPSQQEIQLRTQLSNTSLCNVLDSYSYPWRQRDALKHAFLHLAFGTGRRSSQWPRVIHTDCCNRQHVPTLQPT